MRSFVALLLLTAACSGESAALVEPGRDAGASPDPSSVPPAGGGDLTDPEVKPDAGGETPDAGVEPGADPKPPPPLPPVTPGASPAIKVMTFNIRREGADVGTNAWANRKPLVVQVFQNQDADLVGVQEAFLTQLTDLDQALPGYARIGEGRGGGNKGTFDAIYYRKSRFTVQAQKTFWLSSTPNVAGSTSFGNDPPRTVTWGRFAEVGTNYQFYLYNTHFDDQSQPSREKSAILLMNTIARRSTNDTFLVTGDLNAPEGSNVIRFLKGRENIDGKANPLPMRDTFRVDHPNVENAGTFHAFTGDIDRAKIDYVFAGTADQQVLGASIDRFNVAGRYPSDHFPVIGRVQLPAK